MLRRYLPSVSYSIVKDLARRTSDAGGSARHTPLRTAQSIGGSAGITDAEPFLRSGGDSGARTRSLRLAKPALSQLSYIPGAFPAR